MDEKLAILESLLNQKSSLEKDALHYYEKYVKEFGEQIQRIFESKLESILSNISGVRKSTSTNYIF